MHPAPRLTSLSSFVPRGLALVALAWTLAGPAAAADDTDEAFYQRAATCAAAMQVDQLALAYKARAGDQEAHAQLLQLTRLGFAYVGTAYLHGLRDPRGSDMLKAATAEQKSWPAARHTALAAECHVEAQKVYDNAGGMWQWAIDKKAKSRVDRFLSAPTPASSASR